MEIILDAWEGSGDIDEPTLVDNNAAGIITRINEMQGGHHDDKNFKIQWEQNKAFQLQSLYFVYNPWVNGSVNWQWLSPRIPTDCPRRIFIDVEVRYKGYLPTEYGMEVNRFLDKCLGAGYWPTNYTGAGYLDLLKPWRKDLDYWWARYPFSLIPSSPIHRWEDLKGKLSKLDFRTADLVSGHVSPGPVKLWQVSDQWVLPGCAGHKMDISIWPGTMDELKTWWGVAPAPAKPSIADRLPAFLQKLHQLEEEYV